ncbi:flavocytochrome c [Campylobacter sp. 2018MI01]|uniref:flavocytochrome c n=1 Tax=Campylobacter sp. 2018MI01 TaxID=2836735 RepID=UPI001BD9C495|nr:flavocytochrome c [Campylobacter sp. 2018MI01]MBT0879564.1 flavocytochrome c [Campylobacter sp. 2018MI01]
MLSRRNFIKRVAGVGLSAPLALNANDNLGKDIKFDEIADVIIIGSGVSAHICAAYLVKNKIDVLMIEKMDRIGGNSVLSQQDFAVLNSDLQIKAGIKDSEELFLNDLNKAGAGYNHLEHSLRIIRNSNEAYEFAKSCGVKYADKLKFLGGHSVARSVETIGGGGACISTLNEFFIKHNGKIKNETKCDEIIQDESGKIIGVSVRENYRFNRNLANDDRENLSGDKKHYKARLAVVFATGGFSCDIEFRSIVNPRLRLAKSPSSLGQTAGALKQMLKVGAIPTQLALSRFSFGIPTEDLIYGIMVDCNAKRFLNEDGDRQGLSNKILAHMEKINTTIYPIIIFDSIGFANSHDPNRMQSFITAGKMKKFDSLSDLANNFKLNENDLSKTMQDYETGISNNKDEFKKDLSKIKNSSMSKAPFYAMTAAPGLSYTPGGVYADINMRVLNISNYEPIKGLYAIGEATGGVHGQSRLTSCSIPDCMTSGIACAKDILKGV